MEVEVNAWVRNRRPRFADRAQHRERIRLALDEPHYRRRGPGFRRDEIMETLIGKLGRSLYERGSRALHAGMQQKEVRKIVDWVELIIDEVLPGPPT